MSKIKFFIHSILFLPATIIHELLHAFIAIIFMFFDIIINMIRAAIHIKTKPIVKVVGFNLIPNHETGNLGSVTYMNASPTQSILINLAPLLSLLIMIFTAIYLQYVSIEYVNILNFSIHNTYEYKHQDLIVFFIFIQLFIASKPSKTDIKNAFREVISLNFIVELILYSVIIYGYLLYLDGELINFFNGIGMTFVDKIRTLQ
ncbi:hypothetical protein GJV85_13385 (plasmid) [Sulfurimonas aquatica]|uniref:Uncharacterized protein n=1 Tax=Sulfurimonas aquatica TaxID=2672570 RepID=A0A975GE57_9BACT|nr:hypothetical protein [Sulfurimonas aquatica]QSZ43163.1 hypothetical protein GJV85_13385 [Sulfurimonas aquatica]